MQPMMQCKSNNITYPECVCLYPKLSSMQCSCVFLYRLQPVRLYHVFPHSPTNGTIFGKYLLSIKCVCVCVCVCVCGFSLHILSDTFLTLRRTERDIITNVPWSSCKEEVILGTF